MYRKIAERALARVGHGRRWDQLLLQRRVKALAHRVIEAVADRAYRDADPGLLTAAGEQQSGVLGAVVGMMDHPARRAALRDGHLERRYASDSVAAWHSPSLGPRTRFPR